MWYQSATLLFSLPLPFSSFCSISAASMLAAAAALLHYQKTQSLKSIWPFCGESREIIFSPFGSSFSLSPCPPPRLAGRINHFAANCNATPFSFFFLWLWAVLACLRLDSARGDTAVIKCYICQLFHGGQWGREGTTGKQATEKSRRRVEVRQCSTLDGLKRRLQRPGTCEERRYSSKNRQIGKKPTILGVTLCQRCDAYWSDLICLCVWRRVRVCANQTVRCLKCTSASQRCETHSLRHLGFSPTPEVSVETSKVYTR